jgi:tRNA(fMet)-specific endonuclease VapC
MTLWILDTDHVSLFQSGHPLVTKRVQSIDPNALAVTIVTVEEQMYGRLNRIRRAKSPEDLSLAYFNLNRTLAYFQTIDVIDFVGEASLKENRVAADCYQEIIGQKLRVGTQDLKIAAITLSRQAIVVTRNNRDFGKVSGLQIEDWSI